MSFSCAICGRVIMNGFLFLRYRALHRDCYRRARTQAGRSWDPPAYLAALRERVV